MKTFLLPIIFCSYLNVNSQVYNAGIMFSGYYDINLDTLINYTTIPNPSAGIFTVNLNNKSAETKIFVYDLLGSCLSNTVYGIDVSPKTNGSTTLNINLSGQDKGIYFVEIVADGNRTVKKVVLN